MPDTNEITCSEPGCTRTDIKAKNLCRVHYDRQWDAKNRPPKLLAKDQPCAQEGCPNLVGRGGHGLCKGHYDQERRGTLNQAPKLSPTYVGICPRCHLEKKLDRNGPEGRICQVCYRDRVPVPEGERRKPGRKPDPTKPRSRYRDRGQCPAGHDYVEGSFKIDDLGRRYCITCFQQRRKTQCPQGHGYTEENTYTDKNGGRHCLTCQRETMRQRRPPGLGQGGFNANKTECPRGHPYDEENTSWSKDGRRWCKACARLNNQVQNLKRFNLTMDQYDAMLQRQGNCCDSCGDGLRLRHIHIDHDHKCCDGPFSCGKCVRGLLCSDCNPGLGYFHDEPWRLRAAAEYLDRHA